MTLEQKETKKQSSFENPRRRGKGRRAAALEDSGPDAVGRLGRARFVWAWVEEDMLGVWEASDLGDFNAAGVRRAGLPGGSRPAGCLSGATLETERIQFCFPSCRG